MTEGRARMMGRFDPASFATEERHSRKAPRREVFRKISPLDSLDYTQPHFADGVIGPVRNEPVTDDFDFVYSAILGRRFKVTGQRRQAS